MRKAAKALLVLLAAALALAVFNGIRFQKRTNNRPLPAQYKKGVFHLHSRFSDGLGSVAEICRAARSQGLDFVILTDHGRPNPGSSAATAWNNDTLLIGASEFSLHAGHMAAAGYRLPGYVFPPEAQEAIDDVNRDGGVTFISHPFDRKIPWTDWQARGFTGIEILSLYQLAKQNILYGLTLFPLQYLLSPDYALTALVSYPRREMAIWDRTSREGKCFAIFALDTHAKLPLGRKTSLHFPSYAATFRILNVYARIDGDLAPQGAEPVRKHGGAHEPSRAAAGSDRHGRLRARDRRERLTRARHPGQGRGGTQATGEGRLEEIRRLADRHDPPLPEQRGEELAGGPSAERRHQRRGDVLPATPPCPRSARPVHRRSGVPPPPAPTGARCGARPRARWASRRRWTSRSR